MITIHCAGRSALAADAADAVAAAARRGGLVLFPTDTLYGLGADPLSERGLAALFRLKGREPGKPVLVLLADEGQVDRFAAAIPAPWRTLMAKLWPGPLTLLFPARAGLPAGIRSAAGSVALRVPGSALCRSVLRAAGGSLTGTSANPAGEPGASDAGASARRLGSTVDVVVDAGVLPGSLASTLLGIDAAGAVQTLREGATGDEAIRLALAGGDRQP